MSERNLLLVSAPDSKANSWAETLEEILDAKINVVDPRQVAILELNGVYSLVIIDSSPDPAPALPTLELCQRIRRRFDDPIVLLIDSQSEQSAIDAYAAEVDECIVKPISVALLAAKIKSWLRWSSDYVPVQDEEITPSEGTNNHQNHWERFIC